MQTFDLSLCSSSVSAIIDYLALLFVLVAFCRLPQLWRVRPPVSIAISWNQLVHQGICHLIGICNHSLKPADLTLERSYNWQGTIPSLLFALAFMDCQFQMGNQFSTDYLAMIGQILTTSTADPHEISIPIKFNNSSTSVGPCAQKKLITRIAAVGQFWPI